jgi:hypothetical protein
VPRRRRAPHLDANAIDCYDCRYVGVPERREWSDLYLEERWAVIAHADGQRSRDSAEVRQLLQTITLAAATDEEPPWMEDALLRMLAEHGT